MNILNRLFNWLFSQSAPDTGVLDPKTQKDND